MSETLDFLFKSKFFFLELANVQIVHAWASLGFFYLSREGMVFLLEFLQM